MTSAAVYVPQVVKVLDKGCNVCLGLIDRDILQWELEEVALKIEPECFEKVCIDCKLALRWDGFDERKRTRWRIPNDTDVAARALKFLNSAVVALAGRNDNVLMRCEGVAIGTAGYNTQCSAYASTTVDGHNSCGRCAMHADKGKKTFAKQLKHQARVIAIYASTPQELIDRAADVAARWE